LEINLGRALRSLKPERRAAPLSPRGKGGFASAASMPLLRTPIFPDTNVYIRNAEGSLPQPVADLLDLSIQFHCSVCLGELAVGLAAYSPAASGYRATRDYYAALMERIPDNRILVPDEQTWIEAGIVAGTLARTQSYQPHQRKALLNDALIYLTATKDGLAVLTENKDDFDLIQQIASRGSFIHF
jgi:predicted nucleic acid-binding protein